MNSYTMFLIYLTLNVYIRRNYYCLFIYLKILLLGNVNHIYNTRYKTNIYLNVPVYHKNVGMRSSVSIAIKLCRVLKINMYNFKNINDLNLNLNNVDLTQISL